MTIATIQNDDRVLTFTEIRHSTGKPSRTTIWRMCRRGEFPKPIRISPGRVGWLKSEVDAWKASCAAARAA